MNGRKIMGEVRRRMRQGDSWRRRNENPGGRPAGTRRPGRHARVLSGESESRAAWFRPQHRRRMEQPERDERRDELALAKHRPDAVPEATGRLRCGRRLVLARLVHRPDFGNDPRELKADDATRLKPISTPVSFEFFSKPAARMSHEQQRRTVSWDPSVRTQILFA